MTRSGSRRRRPTPRTRRVRVGRSVAFAAATSASRTGPVAESGSSGAFFLRVPPLAARLTVAPSESSAAGRAGRRRGRRVAGSAAPAEEISSESSPAPTADATEGASTAGASPAVPFDAFVRERDRPRPPRRRRRRGAAVPSESSARSPALVERGSSGTASASPFPALSRTAVGARPRVLAFTASVAAPEGAPASPVRRLRPRPPRRRRRRGVAPAAPPSKPGVSPPSSSTSSSEPVLVSSITPIPSF
ncbi:hypothetical protein BH20ACT24_BH20ACT24_10650 [soil metagenome]